MSEHLADTNVGNIGYIRKLDAIDMCGGYVCLAYCMSKIKPADVVPVVHGKWLPTNDENKKRCNKCDTVVLIAMYPNGNANFCPNCGAIMDAKEE